MKRPLALIEPEFEPFLYASLGEEGNGMNLSVLSMLARRNLDPWTEAAELAALPVDAAAKRLTAFVAGLPGTAGPMEARATAHRLILLLPKPAISTAPPSAARLDDAFGMTKGPFAIWMIVMSLIMGAQFLAGSQQPPAQTKQAVASAAKSVPTPNGHPLNSGR